MACYGGLLKGVAAADVGVGGRDSWCLHPIAHKVHGGTCMTQEGTSSPWGYVDVLGAQVNGETVTTF